MKRLVYLDSHFLSREVESPGWLSNRMLNDDDVCFVFSSIHYLEAMPRGAIEARELSLSKKRLELIAGCRSKIFVSPVHEILQGKIVQSASISSITCKQKDVFGELGLGVARSSVIKKLANKIQENETFQALPRSRRRALVSGFKAQKIGNVDVVDAIRCAFESSKRGVQVSCPELLPIFSAGGILDWILGKVSDRSFSDLFYGLLSKPEVFCFTNFDDDEIGALIANFRETLDGMVISLVLRLKKMESYLVELAEEKNINQRAIKSTILDVIPKIAAEYVGNGAASEILKAQLERLFMVVAGKIFIELDKAGVGKFRDGIVKNDICDILHTMYHGYVDVFCCDKGTKYILDKNVPGRAIVCKNDIELRRAISAA